MQRISDLPVGTIFGVSGKNDERYRWVLTKKSPRTVEGILLCDTSLSQQNPNLSMSPKSFAPETVAWPISIAAAKSDKGWLQAYRERWDQIAAIEPEINAIYR